MFKIGIFSKLSRVSIRMLRYYDEEGLLKPEYLDLNNSYRYYSAKQLENVSKIQALQKMGFSLAVIKEILCKHKGDKELIGYIKAQYIQISNQKTEIENKLLLLNNFIKSLEKESNNMNYDVVIKQLPKRKVASVRKVIPRYDAEGMLWEILCNELQNAKINTLEPNYGLAIYHDKGFKDSNVDVEIQVSVENLGKDTQDVKYKEEKQIEYASAIFTGGYEKISEVNRAVADWITNSNYQIIGNSFAIYHVHPNSNNNPDEYVTEICYPVKNNL